MKKMWVRGSAIGFITILLIGLVLPIFSEKAYGAEAYTTDEYNTAIKVEENNTIYVTETIKVNFLDERHGIYRYIPYKGKTEAAVGGEVRKLNFRMKIDEIDIRLNGVSCEYSSSYENSYLILKIGSAEKTVYGPQEYTISYRCRLYDDGINEYDLVYWDLIPTGWETPIVKSSMSIQIPKSFGEPEVEFISGIYGATYTEKVPWFTQEGTTLMAQALELGKGEGVTFLMVLPEGSFQGELTNDWAFIVMYVLMFVPPIIIALLWFVFGRDPKIIKTVEFYPPEGMTPAEVGYIVDGVVDKKDIISMIIYFADKGVLRIEDRGQDKFTLYKEKELPTDAKIFEQTLLEGIFKDRDEVRLEDLGESFYSNYKAAISQLEAYYNKEKEKRVFTLGSRVARFFSLFLMFIPILCGYVFAAIGMMLDSHIIVGIAITSILILGAIILIFTYDRKDGMKASKMKFLIGLGAIIIGIGTSSGFIGMWRMIGLLPAVVVALSTFLSLVFTVLMKKRSHKSADIMGRLLGFKEFINAAELERIKLLVDQNPSYFYNVLPYAYVFGLSDKWAKKFEVIKVEAPTWYTGSYTGSMFNTWVFMSMMNNCTQAVSNSIVIPTSEGGSGGIGGGGFSAGGGFSGGGFGGGGGGSW